MKEILVSVIMPAYNCEKYIAEAIQSVLQQSEALELIIVEDASSDKTEDVIQSFLHDARVIYIKNQINLGAAASRNKGIELARGKYIAFLDADDCWEPDKLQKQTALMEAKTAVLSSTGRIIVDEAGKPTGKTIEIKETVTYSELLKGNVLNTSGVMVLASVAKKYPMVKDCLHEDYIMWLSILKEYQIAYGLNEPLLRYRIMRGTKSANKLKSAKMTFGVYRYMGIGRLKAVYYFLHYAFNGLKKWMF